MLLFPQSLTLYIKDTATTTTVVATTAAATVTTVVISTAATTVRATKIAAAADITAAVAAAITALKVAAEMRCYCLPITKPACFYNVNVVNTKTL